MKHAVVMKGGIAAVALLAVASTVFTARAFGETLWSKYQKCLDEAAVEANSCYQNADGWWDRYKCDLIWDLNQAACANIIASALK